jgi:hypothetical protein
VKGRARIGFRFTSLRTGGKHYDVQTETARPKVRPSAAPVTIRVRMS